ncbi:dipeptidyl peptidase 2-like [Liolophura sinensis]|uniref:dipeptidyl peptidase 2-like n=1 Tax=Liolophura sinensis TaxID=3198878 RepID=UPI003157F805
MADSTTSTLLAVFLYSAFAVGQQAATPYVEKYFDQIIDHFNFGTYGSQTYKQRYLIQDKWWDGKGPIFFYTGNEGDITSFWENTGLMFDLAPEFSALVLFAEHRYYGKSLPFGSQSFDLDKIGLLTIEQALADYAILLTHIKQELNATYSPVIAFGGSYGGMLSAWMRFKYPNLITGSLAGSAPIYLLTPDIDRRFFYQDVTKDFQMADQMCEPKVRQAFTELNNLAAQGPSGLAEISTRFNLCSKLTNSKEYKHFLGWIRNAFGTLAMVDYPYPSSFLAPIPANPVKVACGHIVQSADVLSGLALASGVLYNGTTGQLKCFDIKAEFVDCADPSGCGTGPNGMAWDYQACTEISLPAGSDNVTDMFPVLPFTPEMREQYCLKTWNVTPRADWGNIQYWGRDIKSASNILFSNGNLDPWHRGGVLKSLSDTLLAVPVEGGAHHLDLRGSNPLDPPGVIKAREVEKFHISLWVNGA